MFGAQHNWNWTTAKVAKTKIWKLILIAGIPFYGPMAAVRVGLLGDDFVLNPSFREIARGDLDLVVAGTPDGVVMVEAGANQLTEQDVIEAIDFGYEAVCELIKAQGSVLKEAGKKTVGLGKGLGEKAKNLSKGSVSKVKKLNPFGKKSR